MIVACVPNIMDRSRFGSGVRFIDAPSDIDGAQLVLVDLDRCDDVAGFAASAARTVGFCAHVDEEKMAEAASLGFDEVLARSAFFRRLPSILSATPPTT